ncbi:hypothetical protein O0I10_008810 [Lichtheimia ornata]|uniref:Uncharacterized protein n=1 Tax=Lichtheimia ornata TaxID=688661 RepID=A0AAD7UXS1_9FUNG|nr:uncharacterized protein O0I10_008810 [Lichtheimia ornata]KAJ8655524.1 hypothetical protein O0I10_008810 [Lichtheimia ornata]
MAQAIDTLKRRLETILYDFKRARSTWHEISDHTLSDVNALVNALIQSRYVDDAAYWHPALCMEYPNMTQAYNKKIQWVIDQHHNKVSSMVDKMGKQHDKMRQQISELHVICKRASDLRGDSFVEHEPLFKTCPMRTYVVRFESIVAMYTDAMGVLGSLLSNKGFKDIKSREAGLSILSIWIHQPSINDDYIKEFEELCEIEIHA